MPEIFHCGGNRRTRKYFLIPRIEVELLFDYEVVLEAKCPKCDKVILEQCGFTYKKGFYPAQRIKGKKFEECSRRIQADLCHVLEPGHKPGKDTSVIIFAGEYTLRISRGADSNARL